MDGKANTEVISIELHFEPAPVSAVKSRILPLDNRPNVYSVSEQNMADCDAFVINIGGIVGWSEYTIEEEGSVDDFEDYIIFTDRSAENNDKQPKYAIYIKIADDAAGQFAAATQVRFQLKYITINNHTCGSYGKALDCLEDILNHRGNNLLTYCTAKINPRICDKHNISIEIEQRISEEELRDFPVSIPHMRICLDLKENPKRYAYVRMDKPEYLSGYDSADISRKKAVIIDVLSSPWRHYLIESHNTNQVRTATGYEAAVNIWIDTYADNGMFSEDVFRYDENGFPIMPDYANL